MFAVLCEQWYWRIFINDETFSIPALLCIAPANPVIFNRPSVLLVLCLWSQMIDALCALGNNHNWTVIIYKSNILESCKTLTGVVLLAEVLNFDGACFKPVLPCDKNLSCDSYVELFDFRLIELTLVLLSIQNFEMCPLGTS